VVFADMGDSVSACSGEILSLAIEGAESAALAAEPDNLVLRAARALATEAGLEGQALLHLL
jgi:4-diphosphocytidyl-2-C-methyl-D-erythritol kinase